MHTLPRTDNLEFGAFKTLKLKGSEYLFFGGTAYLSLQNHSDFLQHFQEGLRLFGLNNGTSRTNNVQLGLYKEAETQLANHFGFEDSILLSSGYLAAQLAIRKLSANYTVLYSPGAHPALWLEESSTLPKMNFQDWVDETVKFINESEEQNFLIVSNTVDNVLPEFYNFSEFSKVSDDKNLHFLLDDSHGIGVLVYNQIASLENLPKRQNIEYTLVASLAKGMGIDAGIILGSFENLENLRKSGFYVGASPSSPAFIYTLHKAGAIYKQQQELLQKNIEYFSQNLNGDWQFVDKFPVFVYKNQPIYNDLVERGIIISSFAYPNPNDPPLDRIVISAHHNQKDLDTLIKALKEIKAL